MDNIYIEIGDLVKIKNFDNYFKVIGRYVDGSIRIVKTNASDGVYHDIYCKEEIVEVKRPCQYKTIYERKEPILDDKEREYLSAVIKPYKVIGIKKRQDDNDEQICIDTIENRYEYIIMLPYFKKGTRYKGMKLNKEYTLEDLGL